MITIEQAANTLLMHDNILILTHHFPDGDTLGSGFALCRALLSLGKKARTCVVGELPKKFRYLCEGMQQLEFDEDFICSVDIADENLLGTEKEKYEGRIALCIDHHGSNTLYAKESLVDSTAAATSEIIVKIIRRMGALVTQEIADCIFTGITTDTGCFRYTNTTAQSFRIAAEMVECGAHSAEINRVMFDTKSRARLEIERMVLDSMEFFAQGRCALICITRKMIDESGAENDELEGLASLPRQVEGVFIGITLRERRDDAYKVSLRTTDGYDASKLCALFGGGGHAAAGGCTIDGPLENAKQKIVEAACAALSR